MDLYLACLSAHYDTSFETVSEHRSQVQGGLGDVLPAAAVALAGLKELSLKSFQLSEAQAPVLAAMPSLTFLRLAAYKDTAVPAALTALSSLRVLSIAPDSMTQLSRGDVGTLTRLPRLETLKILMLVDRGEPVWSCGSLNWF